MAYPQTRWRIFNVRNTQFNNFRYFYNLGIVCSSHYCRCAWRRGWWSCIRNDDGNDGDVAHPCNDGWLRVASRRLSRAHDDLDHDRARPDGAVRHEASHRLRARGACRTCLRRDLVGSWSARHHAHDAWWRAVRSECRRSPLPHGPHDLRCYSRPRCGACSCFATMNEACTTDVASASSGAHRSWSPHIREVNPLQPDPGAQFSCLSEVELFADLSPAEIREIDRLAPARTFRSGELVFSQ